jgi:hypothetical protein
MSTALAVAGVSAVLRDMLNDGFVNHNVSGIVGSTVSVTTLPPDRVTGNGGTETTQLNLFLRQVTPNLSWRNECLPTRDGDGHTRLNNTPLALNLHYLLSAYGAADLHAEILLGYAMQLMHENPVLTRDEIRTALHPSPDVGPILPPALRALADSGLEDQIEQLRITPEYLDSDELSKFWTATQAHYRPSAAYRVSVVLIQATDAARTPLPVLSRQADVRPALASPYPALESVRPANDQPVVLLGTTVTLKGSNLDGTAREVVLVSDRLGVVQTRPALGAASNTAIEFEIPVAQAADFPVGVYHVTARVQRPGESHQRETNALTLTIAPAPGGLPMTVTRNAAGTATFSLTFAPAVRAGQRASIVLGRDEFPPQAFAAPATTLQFVIEHAPAGNHLARLRIDGIDSPIIDRSTQPPAFLDQRINIG